ncbi:MAG: type II toxin-antitoxin system RelE/ParE family toxin [Anaerolineae bacterium]|nr:type II toxin-antitoxin system RelE/ParE family toxin [Phycisphaerae bacterium]
MIPPPSKRVRWIGSSRNDMRRLPKVARHRAGDELQRVQRGELPSDWRTMTSVGPGVCEIRVRTSVAHRVIYIARFEEAVYVLHVFEKRTQKTSRFDIETARRRLGTVERERSGR